VEDVAATTEGRLGLRSTRGAGCRCAGACSVALAGAECDLADAGFLVADFVEWLFVE
jgi:hypothetical protein